MYAISLLLLLLRLLASLTPLPPVIVASSLDACGTKPSNNLILELKHKL